MENVEGPPFFHGNDRDNIVLLDTTFCGLGEEDEEEEENEEMANLNLEWMSQGPFALLVVLRKMSK